jgi:hypothetical protein
MMAVAAGQKNEVVVGALAVFVWRFRLSKVSP